MKREYIIDSSKRIGHGTQGQVFECSSPNFPNEQLCVKRVPAVLSKNDFFTQTNDKAVRETDILKKLQNFNNPHLIKVKDIYEENDHLHFVMERVNGGALTNTIKQRQNTNQKHTAAEILDFIYQFCDGYSLLYENNIFHRDIKSDNVLIQSGEKTVYKITDFGISKIISNMHQQANHTKLGTRVYMSPQLLNSQDYSPSSDVYSFGILLYYFTFFDYPFVATERQILEFQKKIQQIPLKITNLNIEGSFEQIQEVKDVLEKTIVYEEDRRISWADLINRTRSNPIYFPYINKQNQLPMQVASNVSNCVSSFLKLQLLKKRLAQLVIDNFEDAISKNLFNIPPLESNCYLASIYAYQLNLLKNIDAIYQKNYNNLSVQLQSVTPLQQFGEIVDGFRSQMNQTDQQLLTELYQSLNRISQINNIKTATIEIIEKQKIKLITFVQFNNNLKQLNYQTDYVTFWKWVQYFEKTHLRKIILLNENDLPFKPDCVIFYLAYSLLFNQVELLYPQSNLVQIENEENFPILNMSREEAIQNALFYLLS